ncbi:putative F-box domain-containing protein [Rosa chinensis]|uniref:Putative F-box domain-containing protein n=1 Tax=Rosa chinensis TaxID=74649 RepID=A0A2P6PH35_ROSCH|nr:putative F-box domain-containing protein [Rosa chinensis]
MAIKFKSKVRVKDRISDLPDAILCHILSFIPTKYAVRTVTLSTRWKKVWASVPCLDFCPKDFDFYESFLMFVSRLLLYRGSSDIQKFRLRCLKNDSQFPLIDGWICTTIMRHVVELDLDVPGGS